MDIDSSTEFDFVPTRYREVVLTVSKRGGMRVFLSLVQRDPRAANTLSSAFANSSGLTGLEM